MRSPARRAWRSFKGSVKSNARFRKGYLRLKGLYHRARLRGVGLLGPNPADRSARTGAVNPANIVWIFCTSRSGSTWLRSMMEDLARVAEKHYWEKVTVGEKGEGKFYRKATPGGWSEDLTPEQVRVVEEITAPLLKEFYP